MIHRERSFLFFPFPPLGHLCQPIGDAFDDGRHFACIGIYTLWKFPVDTPLYFKAMRFARGARKGWEGCGIVAG